MNILYCTYYDLNIYNAAYNRIKNLSKACKGEKINISIVGSGASNGIYQEKREDILNKILFNRDKFKSFRHSNALKYIAEASKFYSKHLQNLIQEYEISLIFIYSPQGEMVKSILDVSKRLQVNVIADCGEYYDFSIHNFLNGILLQQAYFKYFQMKKLSGITFSAHQTWDKRAKKLKIPNIHIPSITLNKKTFRTSPSKKNVILNIVFMGRLWSRELPNTIFKALKKCVKENLRFQFHIIGTKNDNYRERYWIRKLKGMKIFDDYIRLHGYVDNEIRDKILSEADIFVLLRKQKKEITHIFPFRLPEFLMSGNLTITTNVPPINYYLKENCGVKYISKSNNVNELANLIIALSRQPKKRFEIGLRGRKFAIDNYSLNVIGKKLSTFIKNINEVKS